MKRLELIGLYQTVKGATNVYPKDESLRNLRTYLFNELLKGNYAKEKISTLQ